MPRAAAMRLIGHIDDGGSGEAEPSGVTLSEKTKGKTRLSQGQTPAVRTRGKQQPEVHWTRAIFSVRFMQPEKALLDSLFSMGRVFKRFTSK